MPEHIHLLIWPTNPEFTLPEFLSTLKQSVAKRARNYLSSERPQFLKDRAGRFHFWQDGPGFDRNLWEATAIWETIDYIHLNPVRRGLCGIPEEWEWSSARSYLDLGHSPLPIDIDSLPEDPR